MASIKLRAWIQSPLFEVLEQHANEITKMINGLINSIPNDD